MCLLGPPLISKSTILLLSLFCILGPVHYLLFIIQSLTPVFWFCIFYILVLYLLSLNMCLLGPQLISISTIHLSSLFYILCPIHYLLFMYLSIFNSIIYQFSFLHVCFSLQCLVCSSHIFRYSIVSAPVYCFQIHYNSSHKYTVVNTVTTHQQRSSIHVNVNFPPYTL